MSRLARVAAAALTLAAAVPTGGGLRAQGVQRCAPDIVRAGPRVERPDPDGSGTLTAYLSGPVTVTCGDAVMTGDSAVWRPALERAVMIGSVRYRDTTRTLNSDRLTFFGRTDQVLAEGSVRLVRLATGATLEGPAARFFRTPFAGSRTVATGRPRMTLPSGRGESGAISTAVIDADVSEFLGETEAFARGDVVMVRGDIRAVADSARFSEAVALAVLYGRPVVTGPAFELEGDSIRAGFEVGELRTIHSFGDARATGEGHRMHSEQIRAVVAGDVVETLWAFGRGRSLASSEQFVLAGDSIVFGFVDGRADSLTAVGRAAAAEVDSAAAAPDAPLAEPVLDTRPGANWVAGDTVRAAFRPAAPTQAPEDPEAEGTAEGTAGEVWIDRLVAIGRARSFTAAVRDTATATTPSKNYMLGSRIEIAFEDGQPAHSRGSDAIGVFLEPGDGGGIP
ncbi:MAG: hypothetical protein RRA92_01025 [Gemmatimonadota bacterium]|nr:hypothetical protein [Gemmatimonadota bacterium]